MSLNIALSSCRPVSLPVILAGFLTGDIKNVLSNPKNLEIALMVAHFQDEIKQELLGKLKNSLEDKFSNEPKLKWKIENNKDKYQGFGFEKNSWKNYNIYFQFEETQTNGFIFGVSKINENTADNQSFNDKLKEELKRLGLGIGKSDSAWAWYQNFEDPYYNWGISYEPWVAILLGLNGKMVEKIAERVTKIAKVLDKIEIF